MDKTISQTSEFQTIRLGAITRRLNTIPLIDRDRERTRELAVQGLWSVIVPACLGLSAALLLVQEVEYVWVVN